MTRATDQRFLFKTQDFILTPEKAIYWKQENVLLLADLHLGKAGHFRKSGIPVPVTVNNENLIRLESLISYFKPQRVFFLGDLFHSQQNQEWEIFKKWRDRYQEIHMHLVFGNHDFYSEEDYKQLGLNCSESFKIIHFELVHDIPELKKQNTIYIGGHIHPSVRFKGKGRQSIKCACFHFTGNSILLPAFGNFTGTHNIKPGKNDRVFPIIDDHVLDSKTLNNELI